MKQKNGVDISGIDPVFQTASESSDTTALAIRSGPLVVFTQQMVDYRLMHFAFECDPCSLPIYPDDRAERGINT